MWGTSVGGGITIGSYGGLNSQVTDTTISDNRSAAFGGGLSTDGTTIARTTVSGKAAQILPFINFPRVSETVEGPVERYVEDDGATP